MGIESNSVRGARGYLQSLLKFEAVRRGEFTLKSGAKSDYYIDCRPYLLNAKVLPRLGRVLLHELDALQALVDTVGGMEYGAVPLTTAVLCEASRSVCRLSGVVVRKAAKDHGVTSRLIGDPAGQTVAVLDDVLTTGGSALEAAAEIEKAGGVVVGVVCLVDRLQGAREAVEAKGYEFRSVFTIKDLLS